MGRCARGKSVAGFTLIELVVGLAILVMLVGMVQGIYVTAARNRKSAEVQTAAIHSAAAVLGRLADELANAFTDANRPEETEFLLQTVGEDSTLIFTTRIPSVYGLRVGGESRLMYELVQETDREGERVFILKRTELNDLYGNIDTDGVTYDMLKNVERFSVECYVDPDGWQSSFGNFGATATDELPLAVHMEVAWLATPEAETEDLLATSTTIYAKGGGAATTGTPATGGTGTGAGSGAGTGTGAGTGAGTGTGSGTIGGGTNL